MTEISLFQLLTYFNRGAPNNHTRQMQKAGPGSLGSCVLKTEPDMNKEQNAVGIDGSCCFLNWREH